MSHPALSDEDKQFLRAILANPAELTAWLAYADWLDEHDDPRAEFVRLEVRLTSPEATPAEWREIAARLKQLRPVLDPNWVAIFDRPRIENCAPKFSFQCPKKWEQLAGTDDPNVRHCATCQKNVYYCHSLWEAQGHAQKGSCVALATGVNRLPGEVTNPGAALVAHLMGEGPMPDPIPAPPSAVAGRVLVGLVVSDRHRRREPKPPKRPWWKFW